MRHEGVFSSVVGAPADLFKFACDENGAAGWSGSWMTPVEFRGGQPQMTKFAGESEGKCAGVLASM